MTTYRIPQPDVSAEVFDQEVLAINLKSGHYHSLRNGAVPLWNLLTQGHSIESAAAALATATSAPLETVLNDTRQLVETALAHGLLEAIESSDSPAALPVAAGPYSGPVLEHYSDMQELLLIDPVHEVDVSGWPRQPGDAPSAPGA